MNRLEQSVRIDEQHVDFSSLQHPFSAGGKPGSQPDLSVQPPWALHQQIHVTATGLVVNTGAEDAYLAVRPEFVGDPLPQGQALGSGEAH